jgi:hypothetical protein
MIVRVGDKLFDSTKEPIRISLSPMEKEIINKTPPPKNPGWPLKLTDIDFFPALFMTKEQADQLWGPPKIIWVDKSKGRKLDDPDIIIRYVIPAFLLLILISIVVH